MKRSLISIIVFISLCFCSFAKELAGEDLKAVHKILDAKLFINDYESAEERMAYVLKVEKSINFSALSDEAALICKNCLIMAKESAVDVKYDLELLVEQSKNAKKEKEEKEEKIDEAAKKKAMDFFATYQNFAATHDNLSSHFWFHYKEAEFATVAYLPKTQQLKILGGLLDEYKRIEEINPNNSENLFMYGMILYMMPGILGGSKKNALAKIRKAIDTAACDYETATASMMLAQILLEDKKTDEAKVYIDKASKIDPKNKMLLMIKELNDKGYSFFQIDKYAKKYAKSK